MAFNIDFMLRFSRLSYSLRGSLSVLIYRIHRKMSFVLFYLSVSNGLFFLFFPSAVSPEIVTWVISLGRAFALSFVDMGWVGTLRN